MRIFEFVKNGTFFDGAENVEITSLQMDSRKCNEGSLYFALSGYTVDGHDFVEGAKANGAAAVVVEHRVDVDIPQVVVENSRIAMAHAAEQFFGEPAKNMKVIGVTGTNGKTSISYMIRAIAQANGISCGVIGTGGIWVDNEKLQIPFLTATTPDPIELQYILKVMAEKNAQWVVMEVTAHALELNKVEGMHFIASGFTNLTQDHLDFFKTMENYAAAKERFFTKTLSSFGVINIDDEFGKGLIKKDLEMLTYSVKGEADLQASNIEIRPDGSNFDLKYKNETQNVKTNTTGMFNISNALCAIGCAMGAGVSFENAVKGIATFKSVPGRFESIFFEKREISVIIDYAHTPDGLENILSSISEIKKGRLITVFGCGGNRDATKRPIMGRIAAEYSDTVIITSDNPRFEEPEDIIDSIEVGVREKTTDYLRIADRREAIKTAVSIASKYDVIAICGKGDEDYQEIKGVKYDFSDREEVEKLKDQEV